NLKYLESDLEDASSRLNMYGKLENISKARDGILESQRDTSDKIGLGLKGEHVKNDDK
ncbi:hypothetical protein KI387_016000, partial [Taxus chinensis]